MTAIVNKHGQVVAIISGNEETIELNTPNDCIAIDEHEDNAYFDHASKKWIELPPKPNPHSTFDYVSKKWIDSRSIEQVKADKWEEIKSQRDIAEFGGFMFDGVVYDSDIKSQSRIIAAAQAGITTNWVAADNTLNYVDTVQLANALAEHISFVHERASIARERIRLASTIDVINAVTM